MAMLRQSTLDMNPGIIIYISGRDTEKRAQFVRILSKMLQDRGYFSVELFEQQVAEKLGSTDNGLLARAISWASELLVKTEILVLVSVSTPLSKVLTRINGYEPALELTIDEEPTTLASQTLSITAETMNLPQEIAQVILLLETRLSTSQEISSAEHLDDDNVIYSSEEEALLEAHLRALGYL
jgi:hypothetical protein